MKLALLIGNRGFFPSSVIDGARDDMRESAKRANVELLEPPAGLTRYGAVESTADGLLYSEFLRAHEGEYDGLIICLPNFGDENGIKAAIRNVRTPILVQAYPDEIGRMDFANRRDAFCGKLGLTSVLKQMGVRFTSGTPFVMHPLSEAFERELGDFAAICRIVTRMRHLRVGVFGARTTAFKSVRYDEIAMERHGVDTESLDFSQVLARFEQTESTGAEIERWRGQLHETCCMDRAPDGTDVALARLGLTFERLIGEMKLDCVAIRCWSELQQSLRITPCAVMGVLNERGIPAVCETDVTNALMMMALSLAGDGPVGCMDINNNYGDDPEKCILFHCGPLPTSLMTGPGRLGEHKMFQKTMGENCSWGVNLSHAKAGGITLGGGRTENGEVQFYLENGELTDDPVEEAFFGTPGVLRLPGLQDKLMHLSEAGFRHHAIYTMGNHTRAAAEALEKYLGYRRIAL